MNFSLCERCQRNSDSGKNFLTLDHLKQGQWQRELVSCHVSILILEGQPGGRGWPPYSLIP